MKLHHIALGARDVEGVAQFYRDAFGLAEARRHTYADGSLRSIWLESGPVILMIERVSAAPDGASDLGPFLLAFEVTESERTHAERALERAGALIEARTEFTSYARDPEGNRVAVSHYPRSPARTDMA